MHEYNAVTSSKRVDQLVNIIVREEDTRLINAINKLTSDRPFVITGFFTIGEDKMVLLELLDIDILYHMTVLSPKHSRFQNIVQEIKNQLPPPSPTSPINYQTTVTSINPSTLPTLTPQTFTPTSSPSTSISSSPVPMNDSEFNRFYAFYQTFQKQNKDDTNITSSSSTSCTTSEHEHN